MIVGPIFKRGFGGIKRFLKTRRAARTEDYVQKCVPYWNSLKGAKSGTRAWIIGNGPSLRMADLECLKNEVTIASNKIYLAFGKTNWHPTYYTISDYLVWEKVRRCISRYVDIVHISSRLPLYRKKNVRSFRALRRFVEPKKGIRGFSSDLGVGAFEGGTVTFVNLQFAVHLGCDPIYLIGCDHSYRQPEQKTSKQRTFEVGREQNHFDPSYRRKGEIVNYASIPRMEDAYRCTFEFAEANGITIMNLTRGGELEVFPRGDFDEIV